MKRALHRARAFSQQALRRREEPTSGRGTSSTAKKQSLELDGRSYLLPTLTLPRGGAGNGGGSFPSTRARRTPIVLDLRLVSSDGSPHAQPIKKHELRAEIERLQNAGFLPVGVTNASEDVKQLAAAMNLPYFISTRLQGPAPTPLDAYESADDNLSVDGAQDAGRPQRDSIAFGSTPAASGEQGATPTPSTTPSAAETNARVAAVAPSLLPPMVVTTSVRSGQQIFAQNRSLVVLGSVSSGAEVLADEDVLVMGALKGRALAGIGGNVSARIICQSFDAELISIAHHFTTCDELDERKHRGLRAHKPTIVSLQDDQLHFQSSQ